MAIDTWRPTAMDESDGPVGTADVGDARLTRGQCQDIIITQTRLMGLLYIYMPTLAPETTPTDRHICMAYMERLG